MKKRRIVLFLELFLIIRIVGLAYRNYLSESRSEKITENHYPKNELEESFEKNQSENIEGISAIITSHHFLARDLIAKTFSKTDGEKIKNVVIVSPDHFKQIDQSGCLTLTANIGWRTELGTVEPNSKIIEKIKKDEKVCTEINAFRGEHGIYTLVPFIKNYLPEAKLIPLILKAKKDNQYFYNLGKKLAKVMDKKTTLLVVSSDFSHYMPSDEAKKNDLASVEILKNKDKEKIDLVNNDCPQCIAFLFGYLGKKTEFNLIENTNSYKISGENFNYVTSYVLGYYK